MKQVLVVRKDLNMRKGKMAVQCAHASFGVFLRNAHIKKNKLVIPLTESMKRWLNEGHKKVCVSVDSEEELMEIFMKAIDAGLFTHITVDSGLTEFKGKPTRTVLAVGPNEDAKIDLITGNLKLL